MDDGNEDTIFDRETDRIARATLIKGAEVSAPRNSVEQALDFPNRVSAMLMRHEAICFSLYGENMIVPLLIHAFGTGGLLELIEQGAIKFSLQRHLITYMVEPQKGVAPLMSGKLNSATHTDPEASVAEPFRRSVRRYEAKALRRLKRALADAYVDPGPSYAPHAVRFGLEGYKAGRFRFAGLDPAIPADELDLKGREKLAALAGQMHSFSLIANLRMNTLDEFTIARVCHDSIDRLHRGGRLEQAYQRVFQIERVPDLAELFRTGKISTKSLPGLRMKRDAEKFRRWMRVVTRDPHADDAGTEYLAAIAGDRNFWATPKGRTLKTITVSALSSGIGALLAGPTGAVIGGAAGSTIAGPAVDMGLDLLDEFVLDGVLAGWKPRHYFENVIFPAETRAPDE
ncbi:MAG TPA: hypothetical protein VK550_01860 [Polyangiaceae bacterium]|nr:hypothetical protein [Polyangiaceae bacterium]